jgi:nitrate/TMAO reductase-like tetraheme cytochrome c subunit
MKTDLIKKIESLDEQFDNYFSKFQSETENKATEYNTLIKDNADSAKQINQNQREINRLKEQT